MSIIKQPSIALDGLLFQRQFRAIKWTTNTLRLHINVIFTVALCKLYVYTYVDYYTAYGHTVKFSTPT